MHDKIKTLYELCEVISHELEDVNEKIRSAGGGMSAGDLELVDKLSHAMKSIKTTIAMMEAEEEEGGYSERYTPWYGGMSYADDGTRSDGMSRRGGRSYARGRGRNAKRDSMGRYSREGGYSYAEDMEATKEEMRELAQKMPEEHRRKIERALDDLR